MLSSLVFGFVALRGRKAKSNINITTDTNPDDSLNRDEKDYKLAGNIKYLNRIHYELTFVLKTFFFVLMGLILTVIPVATIFTTFLYAGIFTLALFGIRFLASTLSTAGSPLEGDRNIVLFTIAQGLTPAVLAVSAITYDVPNSQIILAVTLAVILYTNIITIRA